MLADWRHMLIPLLPGTGLLAMLVLADKDLGTTVVLLILFLAQRRLEAGEVYPTFSRAFYPALPVLDAIPRRRPERVVALGHLFVPNVSAMYELEDVRAYEAMTLGAAHAKPTQSQLRRQNTSCSRSKSR